ENDITLRRDDYLHASRDPVANCVAQSLLDHSVDRLLHIIGDAVFIDQDCRAERDLRVAATPEIHQPMYRSLQADGLQRAESFEDDAHMTLHPSHRIMDRLYVPRNPRVTLCAG